ncbi:MAG: FGGY-family carbohydrate kinase [Spirochaetales bacterium]|nr:FGGY-family carbohydrate kinase [Spirochaetales bacterium]
MSGHTTYLLSYDIGSTGCKTCLYSLSDRLRFVDGSLAEYSLVTVDGDGVEQDPEDWWKSMIQTTQTVMKGREGITISGISFCAQMQGLVLVDENLSVLRPAMSYMDQRSIQEKQDVVGHGIQVEGVNLFKLLKSLAINGAVSASVKDPVYKYKWVQAHEPEVFAKVHKWLDVKDYLIARATGECTMTADSAFATFLTSKKSSHTQWSSALLRMYGVNPSHMPRIVSSTECIGGLQEGAAQELGIPAGIPVFGGGGDASMISVGAGATCSGDAYVYTGTSGWMSLTVEKPKVDIGRRIAAITGAQKDRYLFFAEQETAGKCLEWVKDHLALDEIDIYLNAQHVADDPESEYESLYEFLMDSISTVPAGSNGVVFAPWLHGNRAPFDDPDSRGIFFNLSLSTGKRAMIRAVVEGIVFHQKWLMESIEHSFPVKGEVGFVGGGALSSATAQLLADILERPVRRMADPRHAGAAGAAITIGVGLGLIPNFEDAKSFLEVDDLFLPDPAHREAYRKNYSVLKNLYVSNRKNFALLNRKSA